MEPGLHALWDGVDPSDVYEYIDDFARSARVSEAEMALGGADRRLPSFSTRRAGHVVVANEVEHHDMRVHLVVPQELEVRKAVGVLGKRIEPSPVP